jgi:hypothetical protein
MPIVSALRDASRTRGRVVTRAIVTLSCWAMVAVVVAGALRMANAVGLLVAVGGGLILATCWGRPRLALVVWLLSVTMVPIWISIHFLANVPFHCVVAIMAAAATITRTRITVTVFDAYLGLFLAVSLAAVLLAGSSDALWAQMLVRWGIPFLAARILVSATGIRFATDVIAFLFAIIGVLAVLEFLLLWHPFVGWNFATQEFGTWHRIQTRGGGDRSEWAFGHSIALGGSLALSIPFIVGSSFSRILKATFLISITAGIVVTASRSSLIAAALTAGICLLYVGKKRSARAAAVAITLMAAVFVTPIFAPVFRAWVMGDSGEEHVSASYRDSLYSTYLRAIEWFGTTSAFSGGSAVRSIDSAVLRIGLEFGWIVLVMALLPVALSAMRVITGRASLAEIAIVGQIPLFATVALITQYESLIFIVAGLAVQTTITAREPTNDLDNISPFKPIGPNVSQRFVPTTATLMRQRASHS